MVLGRAREQLAIDRVVSAARIGTSGVLALTGEPGVGKTALLRWTLTRLDGFRVLRAVGTEPEREVPFAGLLGLLRPALHLMDGIAAPQARALAMALALEEGEAGDRFAIGAATLSLLSRYADDGPVAVLVDDLQWIDGPSVDALLFAARRLSADPIAVVLAGREDEVGEVLAGVDEVRLSGIDRAGVRALVDSLTGAPVNEEWVTRVFELTGGNPLAVAELAVNPDALPPRASAVPATLSASLVDAFSRRLRPLDDTTRAVLLVAVICNGDLRLTGVVCAASDLDPGRLALAADAGLVEVTGGEITFRHPLVRSAIYRDAAPDRRRSVHAAVAAALPAEDVDRRAWHLAEALWAPDAEAAALLHSAGERAADRSAWSVASAAYERAARLSPTAESANGRLLAAASAAWSAGHGPRALALLDELTAAPRSGTEVQALELRAVIAARSGSLREGITLLERAALAGDSPDTRARLLAEAMHANFFLADGTVTRRLVGPLSEALAGATTARARAMGTLALGVAKVLAGTGGIAELRAVVPLLADNPELHGDEYDTSWLLYAPLFLRDTGTGRGLRARIEDARGRAGVGVLPGLLFQVARDGATSDAWHRAAADYTEAIRLARDTGQTTELAMGLAGLAWLQARTGQDDDCRTHAQQALALGHDREIRAAQMWALLALGDLALAGTDVQETLRRLRAVDELLTERGVDDPDLSPHPDLVDTLLRLGRPAEATRLAHDHLLAADRKGQPWSRARARRAVGLVTPDFDEPFGQALDLHADTPDVFETARTELAFGERLRRDARRVEARRHLREALRTFSGLGAEPWADRAATELDLTGERVEHRPLGGVAALTPQELQVGLLLADGRTTREAAAALFLSPKTVEYHLRKVYRKLGIRSRAELSEAVTSAC
ncbi:AAA family ATPase [Gordonia jinghuaiqii]|uniref:AAA family ATPase n=1 Tax=Gordonia jinghuaiqii TaxID=2758710 RepID=A0A7D7LZ87_9ACTN|nr:LuxR family transcriptional regulator [Gordonia jinghuaiqii]MCR5976201.1 AAA family ATPase [Gordonia jinghuaiqii]QMT03438.1 AAA family ATPase [Gordonia jinghuaiqii]